MSTYAIGDIQGCFDSLSALVRSLPLTSKDRIWLVGDLVNRGPKSAEVLRWAISQGDRLTAVLGNHDLHLLARFHGTAKEKKRDTLDDVLNAKDAAQLVGWLRDRPFLHAQGGWVMVHGGLWPAWTLPQAKHWADRAAEGLRAAPGPFLSGLRAQARERFEDAPDDASRVATAVAGFTRMRMLAQDGAMVGDFDGPPDDGPKGARAWFEVPRQLSEPVVFGHWSALGLHLTERACALDTGCVWGRKLTALRLEDRAVFQVDALESAPSNQGD